MIKSGINITLIGIGLIILTAYFYFSENEEKITNKFMMTVNKSYLFNWAPMMGISFLVVGEFIIWETQHNKNLNEMKTKFLNKYRQRISTLKTDLLNVPNQIV